MDGDIGPFAVTAAAKDCGSLSGLGFTASAVLVAGAPAIVAPHREQTPTSSALMAPHLTQLIGMNPSLVTLSQDSDALESAMETPNKQG
jgi:hypothetical protein